MSSRSEALAGARLTSPRRHLRVLAAFTLRTRRELNWIGPSAYRCLRREVFLHKQRDHSSPFALFCSCVMIAGSRRHILARVSSLTPKHHAGETPFRQTSPKAPGDAKPIHQLRARWQHTKARTGRMAPKQATLGYVKTQQTLGYERMPRSAALE